MSRGVEREKLIQELTWSFVNKEMLLNFSKQKQTRPECNFRQNEHFNNCGKF